MKSKRSQPEAVLQKSIATFLRYSKPNLLWFHVPNGGKRNAIEGAKFKAMGVLAGVADILIFKDCKFYAIELKAGKGSQSDAQQDFMNNWIKEGGEYELCRSIDDLKEILA